MSVAGRAGITYITLMRPSFPIRWYAALVGLLWLLALPAQAGQLAGAIDEIDADVLFLRHALAGICTDRCRLGRLQPCCMSVVGTLVQGESLACCP